MKDFNFTKRHKELISEITTEYINGGLLNTSYYKDYTYAPEEMQRLYNRFGQLTIPAINEIEQREQLAELEEIREKFKHHFNRS